MKSWVEISEQRLVANYNLLVQAANGDAAVLAVVKANAYGHGATLCAPVLARAGAQWLGVADLPEAIAIRDALTAARISPDSQPRIIILCGLLPEDAGAVVQHGFTPVVWEQQQMESLAAAVLQRGGSSAPHPLHLVIDTGMARQGIAPGEGLHTLLHWLKRQPRLRLDGVMTHFASGEVADSPQTRLQKQRFEEAIAAIAEAGLRPAWVHAGNSSTLDNQAAENNVQWLRTLAATVGASPIVRSGVALYGYCLPIEQSNSSRTVEARLQCALQPVMTWKTRVLSLRDIQPGDTVGYNAIFTATHPMRLALLPVGYADGLRRELSGSNAKPGGWTIIHGQKAPIVGRVSMNLTVVDVTGIHGVALDDEVIILGDGITADDHARLAHTISYEILCAVRAVPRLIA